MDLPAFVSRTIRSRPEGESCPRSNASFDLFCLGEKERGLYTRASIYFQSLIRGREKFLETISLRSSFFSFFFFFLESRSTDSRRLTTRG